MRTVTLSIGIVLEVCHSAERCAIDNKQVGGGEGRGGEGRERRHTDALAALAALAAPHHGTQ
jgi:hypothetical protein